MDPLAPLLADPYVASYVYVHNRPLVAVDPSGEVGIVVLGGLIVLGLVGYGATVIGANAYDNWQHNRPPNYNIWRGMTLPDMFIAGISGLLGGPVSGGRTAGARLMLGGGLGVASTAASQEFGNRDCDAEKRLGVAGSAIAAALTFSRYAGGLLFGGGVGLVQGVGTQLLCNDDTSNK